MKEYKAPQIYISPHMETIIPALFRRVRNVTYERERIRTPDDDFLDLDWIRADNNTRPLVIISHGLEGDSHRPYVKGMARTFARENYDVLAWNFRGCSGEMNLKPRFYHSGATEDLHAVVEHAITKGYSSITLVGFSLGGNLTLKYLGERKPPSQIRNAITFSVPLDLHTSCIKISRPDNWMYAKRFIRNLKKKIRLKEESLPGTMNLEKLSEIKTLIAFDDAYTAPLHGFKNAVDYYQKCSSIKFIDGITVPTLLVNAKNDPFLSEECYPEKQLESNSYVLFKSPRQGGHVGFTSFNEQGTYWSEQEAIHFAKNH